MDPVTAAVLAIVSLAITQGPNIVSDVEKLITAIKGGDLSGLPPAPAALLPPITPEVKAAMAIAFAQLQAAMAAHIASLEAPGQSAYAAALEAGPV